MERFWSKVEKTDTCWLWRAGTQFGTGRFRFAGENLPAPRVAWLLSREEPVLPGEIILRTCGNLLCVRPEHLKKQSANDDRPREDPLLRFWAKVEKTDTCWLWRGALSNKGYGDFHINGDDNHMLAHRFIWEHLHGKTPLLICHKCDNPACVRPDHLFAGKVAEEYLRQEDLPDATLNHRATILRDLLGHDADSDVLSVMLGCDIGKTHESRANSGNEANR